MGQQHMAINEKDIVWDSQPDSNIQWDEPILAPTVQVKAKEKPVQYSAPKETARAALEGLSLGFGGELEAALRSGSISGSQYENIKKQLESQQQQFSKDYPKTALASEIAGGLVMPGGVFASATKAPGIIRTALTSGAIGGVQGAGKSTEPEKLYSDILTGAGIGTAGGGVLGGIGAAVYPKVQPAARKLQQEGVELTPGAAFGGNVQAFEQAAESVPVVGGLVKGARQQSFESFNRAAYNRALKEIDSRIQVPTDLPARQAGDFTKSVISGKYTEIYPQVSLKLDDNLNKQLDGILNRYTPGKIGQDQYGQLQSRITEIKNDIYGYGSDGISGARLQALKEDIGDLSMTYGQGRGAERLLSKPFNDLEQSLNLSIRNQNPKLAKELKKTDTAYANYKRAELATASARGEGGTFTPAQLESAVRQLDKTKGKSQFARGKALMQDLSGAGYDVLGNKIPDSGTVTRGGIASLLTGGAYNFLDPLSAIATGIGSTLYTKPGMKYGMPLLTKERPQIIQQYGTQGRAALPFTTQAMQPLGGLLFDNEEQ